MRQHISVEQSDAFNETPLPESIPGEQMLYVFHVQLKTDIVYDTSGVKSPNVQSAWSMASQSARELVAEAVRFGQDIDFESILVADAHGSPIIRVAAGDVVPLAFGTNPLSSNALRFR